MKKLFLFVSLSVLSLTFSSCSGDDDTATVNTAPGGTLTFKYDGVSKSFNTTVVDQDDEGNGDIWLTVTASDGSPSNLVSFSLYQGDLGVNAVYPHTYQFRLAGDFFRAQESFSSVVTESDSHHIKGTFAGTIYLDSNGATHNITDGAFDVRY